MEHDLDLRELLPYIDPVRLSYQEWLEVGMGLHEAGYTPEDWESWSRNDPDRFCPGECARKWASFRGTDSPITGGTIVKMAMDGGWKPAASGRELDWEDTIGPTDGLIVDRNWLEGREVAGPQSWDPAQQRSEERRGGKECRL